jgi:hypothetical protein
MHRWLPWPTDLEAQKRPDMRVLPDELWPRSHVVADDQGGRKRQGETQSPPARAGRQFGSPAADSLAANLSLMLALAKLRTSKILKISVLLPTERNIERIIGPEFLGLCVPQGKPPCWQHHIYGACHNGNACCWAHAFCTRPLPQLIEGVARQMQQRLNEIVAKLPPSPRPKHSSWWMAICKRSATLPNQAMAFRSETSSAHSFLAPEHQEHNSLQQE